MASTRLRNSPGQYCIDQQREHLERQYLVYKGKKVPDRSYLPGFGINAGNMAGAYNHKILSNNTPDLESYLFGIGASNLVKPNNKPPMLINKMDDIKFFNQTDAIMPTPLVIENRQRPVGPFSS
tara:strand:+ start:1044 stop:1415 length:372 start_codon:yes stop_codon:yes gene_type:complete